MSKGPEAELLIEVVGPVPANLPETVDQAVIACGLTPGVYDTESIESRLATNIQGSDALFGLPDELVSLLPEGVQVKLVIGVARRGEPASLLGSWELADELRKVRGRAVAALVTADFTDLVGIPPIVYHPIVVETRFQDVSAYVRTVAIAAPQPRAQSLAISLDGRQAVTGHIDGTVQIWDLTTGDRVGDPVRRHPSDVKAVAFISAGLLTAGSSGVDRDSDDKSWLTDSDVAAFAVRPGTDELAVADDAGHIFVLSTGSTTPHARMDQSGSPAVALAATAETIFSTSGNLVLRWTWGARVAGQPLDGHLRSLRALTICGDTLLASGGYDEAIVLWDATTGAEVRRMTVATEVKSLAAAPHGRWLLSGHADGSVWRWDVATGRTIGRPLTGHRESVSAIAMTPDGRMIVTTGADGTLRRWDADTGAPIAGRHAVREQLADVVSDIESATDTLGITSDVNTIATVLAAATTKPPLSVALLGDWGAGKSSFMCQLRDRMKDLARSPAVAREQKAYVSNLRQVTFNAWHYSDDHLWVGLIEQIFRVLREKPPAPTDPGRVHDLEKQLAKDGAELTELDRELHAVQRMDTPFGKVLAPLHSWRVLRGLWSWWLLGGLLAVAAGIAVIVLGQQVLGLVIAVLGPAVAVWNRVGQYVETARAELRDRRTRLDAKIQAATDELADLDPTRRLDRLLAEITAEDRYADFRGLTGRIHHDLRRLSDDLAKADPSPLQRIVLYVDDLDRCAPARVVDVLQAVNLLLTMNLFMVVVAVDPRWLLRSLERHHSGLFDGDVGAVVYLDKIFHIPFALRPMGNRASDYLYSLLPDVQVAEETAPPEELPTPRVQPQQAPAPAAAPATLAPVTQAAPLATAEGLRVTAEERDFLARLAPLLLTTPRAIKKLTNLYRLLRLSVPRHELQEFLDGEYQAAALLLTALAGAPNETRALLEKLATDDDVLLEPETPLTQRLATLIATLGVHQPAEVYRRWAAEIARFGFTTYDLYPG